MFFCISLCTIKKNLCPCRGKEFVLFYEIKICVYMEKDISASCTENTLCLCWERETVPSYKRKIYVCTEKKNLYHLMK